MLLEKPRTTRSTLSSETRRRTQQRHNIRIPVEFSYQGRDFQGQSRNISLGGLFVETTAALPFGATVTVRFQIPSLDEPIEVKAEIRWVENKDGVVEGIGVQFRGLRAKHVWALNKFFAEKK